MCKSGVSGQNNEVETVSNKLSSGDIVDTNEGFTLVSLHLNTMFGTMGGMLVMLGILTCTIIVCAGPIRRAWLALRSCCRAGGDADRRSGGWGGDTGVTYPGTIHQRHSDSHMMRQLSSPSGHNMYPDKPGYGHNVMTTNTGMCEGNVMPPAVGVETGGGRTPF